MHHLQAAPVAAVEKDENDGFVATMDISKVFPRWNMHNGMTCGGQGGTMLTKVPLPIMPRIQVSSYLLDVVCCPPRPTLARVDILVGRPARDPPGATTDSVASRPQRLLLCRPGALRVLSSFPCRSIPLHGSWR